MLLYFLLKSEIRAVAMGVNPELTAVQGANSHLLSWGWRKATVFSLTLMGSATALAGSRFPHKVSSLRAFKRDLIAGGLPDFCSLQSHVFWECVGIRDGP